MSAGGWNNVSLPLYAVSSRPVRMKRGWVCGRAHAHAACYARSKCFITCLVLHACKTLIRESGTGFGEHQVRTQSAGAGRAQQRLCQGADPSENARDREGSGHRCLEDSLKWINRRIETGERNSSRAHFIQVKHTMTAKTSSSGAGLIF